MNNLTTNPPTEQPDKPTKRPAIGEKCLLLGRTVKTRVRLSGNPNHRYPFKTEYPRVKYDEPKEAYYIGYRTVHEGRTDIDVEYGEYGTVLSEAVVFEHKCSWCVWLFIWNDKSAPFEVYPQDVVRTTAARRADGESGVL
jgi:hypothetical protein